MSEPLIVRSVVFDAFGTLFAVEIPKDEIEEIAPGKSDLLLSTYRQKLLEYTWLRNSMHSYTDFAKVANDALAYAFEISALDNPQLFKRLLDVYANPTAFPDVHGCLDQLRKLGLMTSILSNGTLAMLQMGVESAGISGMIDHLCSVDLIRMYKPAPQVYQLVVKQTGIPREQHLFVSGNAWDIIGAANFGFRTAWLNRHDAVFDHLGTKPDFMISSLAQLPGLLGSE